MRVENFSGGYLKTEMKIVPYEDGPSIESEAYEFINRQFYADSDGNPMFRLGLDGNPYFQVSSEIAIPEDVLGIPEGWFADNRIADDQSYRDVFILKPGHADILREAKTLSRRFTKEDTGLYDE